MADRYRCCPTCPKRDAARLFRALGEEAAAEGILEAGCPDWWDADKGFVGSPSAEHPHGAPLVGCGRDLLPRMLASLQRSEEGHAAASEEARNEVVRLIAAGDLGAIERAVGRLLDQGLRRLLRGDEEAPRRIGPGAAGGGG